jgi:hypothetical protein
VGHRGKAQLTESDPFEFDVGGGLLDPLFRDTPPRAMVEHRRILVSSGSQGIEPLRDIGAQPVEMRLQELQQAGLEVERQHRT